MAYCPAKCSIPLSEASSRATRTVIETCGGSRNGQGSVETRTPVTVARFSASDSVTTRSGVSAQTLPLIGSSSPSEVSSTISSPAA